MTKARQRPDPAIGRVFRGLPTEDPVWQILGISVSASDISRLRKVLVVFIRVQQHPE